MNPLISNYVRHQSILIRTAGLLLATLLLATGCSAKYGRLQRNVDVQAAFEANQVPMEYRYYYYGDSEPYVIFGIEPKYGMDSRMWRNVSADTEEFREMVRFLWEDYQYYKFGADILDPNGAKVGIMYTAVRETTVKFVGNNQIEVMPNTPFLWGPDDGNGGGARSR